MILDQKLCFHSSKLEIVLFLPRVVMDHRMWLIPRLTS